MTISIEVCIDNLESLDTALRAGAQRIELCSALALGGLTPCHSFIKQAVALSSKPIYAMVRPRAGDFLFSRQEVNMMVEEIRHLKNLGVAGVVIGALTAERDLDLTALAQLTHAAQGVGITFHRAFDLCRRPAEALEQIIDLGCERLLTSGQQASAEAGIETIRQLVNQANRRLSIMPGAGVNQHNAKKIVEQTGVMELHLSGKTTRPSLMRSIADVKMGSHAEQDTQLEITGFDNVAAVAQLF